MKALRPESIAKRMLEAYPSRTYVAAADALAARLAADGLQISGRTIRSYCKGERRPSAKFCELFARLFGPFELDDWIERSDLPRPYVSKRPDAHPAEREARRLQMLINRFCDWCAGSEEDGRNGTCWDASCVMRPASPLPLRPDAANRRRVAIPESWD